MRLFSQERFKKPCPVPKNTFHSHLTLPIVRGVSDAHVRIDRFNAIRLARALVLFVIRRTFRRGLSKDPERDGAKRRKSNGTSEREQYSKLNSNRTRRHSISEKQQV